MIILSAAYIAISAAIAWILYSMTGKISFDPYFISMLSFPSVLLLAMVNEYIFKQKEEKHIYIVALIVSTAILLFTGRVELLGSALMYCNVLLFAILVAGSNNAKLIENKYVIFILVMHGANAISWWGKDVAALLTLLVLIALLVNTTYNRKKIVAEIKLVD